VALPGFFHDHLWVQRYGDIPLNSRIVHKNGITVDNRVSNLEVEEITLAIGGRAGPRVLSLDERSRRLRGGDLYRFAMSELPLFGPRSSLEQHQTLLDPDGVQHTTIKYLFYECRAPACSILLHAEAAWVSCTICKESRYCSQPCLEIDGIQHSKDCKWKAPLESDDDGPSEMQCR
jgi:zinc finger MYND domain-containing protein 19